MRYLIKREWGVRWRNPLRMVCFTHWLEPRLFPLDSPYLPSSQDPKELMFIWPKTHQNMEVFVVWARDYPPPSLHKSLQVKKSFIQIFQRHLVCVIFLILPSIMGQEEALFTHNDSTNPRQLIRLLSPNTCFPQSQENLDITNDKKKKACLSNCH